ncbi:MAG: DUF4153 domain-containing protein [Chitinophagales bacterium]|nr:DUF4153 domain-containing protein [Hyphomicrobiales bacterium]
MASTDTMTNSSEPIWTRIFGGLTDTLFRFPVPVLLAVALTLFNLYWLPQTGYGRVDPIVLPVNAALTLSLGWCLALNLWAEASGRQLAALVLQIAGAVFFFWLWDVAAIVSLGQVARGVYAEAEFAGRLGALSFNSGLILAGLALAIGLAPYLARRADGEAVWQFNHKVWVGFLAAWFGGLVFYAGVWGSLATIEILFVTQIPDIYTQRAAVIAFNLVPALLWFTLIPRDFAEPAKKGADMEFTSRAVALLVKFIFAPLTYVFAAILLAYSVKVLAQGGFNEARLGQIGVIYSACVVITALLAYPTRDAGWFMRTFWRVWPYLLIAPVVLLIAALYIRFENYGVTPPRYMSALAAVWLAALIAAFTFTRSRADIRLVPGLLAALLLVVAVGPWGVTGLTVRNQAAILEALLVKNNLLVHSRVSKNAPLPGVWIEEDKQRAGSALRELHRWSGMEHIRNWFEGDAQNPLTASKYVTVHAETSKRLGVPAYPMILHAGAPQPEKTFGVHFGAGNVVATQGAKWIAGTFFIYSKGPANRYLPEIASSLPKIKVAANGGYIVVEMEGGQTARFDLIAAVQNVSPITEGAKALDDAVIAMPVEGELKARLSLLNLTGVMKANGGVLSPEWRSATFYVLLE